MDGGHRGAGRFDRRGAPTHELAVGVHRFTVDDVSPAVCSLDGAPALPCASPFARSALADGSHTLTVTATDGAGNVGTASRSWTIDATAPVITIDATAALTSSRSISLGFIVDDGSPTSCSLDNSPAVALLDPFTASGLADGLDDRPGAGCRGLGVGDALRHRVR